MPKRARTYWKGYLRLSLVSIPIEIYNAVESKAEISFRQIHRPSGRRINYEKTVPGIGKIDNVDIVKGYEVEDNEYVILEPDEIDAVKLESKKTIDLVQFVDASEIDSNPFFCPDPEAAKRWEKLVDDARKDGSSLGAVVECVASGVPAGWGAPLYAKLDSELASACMSINAVKGFEIGDGFAAAALTGEQNADPMRAGNGGPRFLANHAGGIAGGIATGQPVTMRVAFKPTSSILTPVDTITRTGEETQIATKGRHDPCVGIRGVPVVEAMVALVLADQALLHRGQCG